MRSSLLMLCFGLLAMLLAGCAPRTPEQAGASSTSSDTSQAPPTALGLAPGDTVVTLKRTSCYGSCPVYSVALLADGRVRYQGRRSVKVEGRAEGRIPPDSVQHLVEMLEAGGYFQLRDAYTHGEACDQRVSDLPSALTSVRDSSGHVKRVNHYHGCRWKGQKRLIALEDSIDAVAGTRRWVKGPGKK